MICVPRTLAAPARVAPALVGIGPGRLPSLLIGAEVSLIAAALSRLLAAGKALITPPA